MWRRIYKDWLLFHRYQQFSFQCQRDTIWFKKMLSHISLKNWQIIYYQPWFKLKTWVVLSLVLHLPMVVQVLACPVTVWTFYQFVYTLYSCFAVYLCYNQMPHLHFLFSWHCHFYYHIHLSLLRMTISGTQNKIGHIWI